MYIRKKGRNLFIIFVCFTLVSDVLENVFSQMYFRDIVSSPLRYNPTGILIGVSNIFIMQSFHT